jgi:selenide,water dikinase
MLTLNRRACEALLGGEIHACTDVTGFGLLGHAREMAIASEKTLEIDSSKVQLLPGALGYAKRGAISGGLKNNREFASGCVIVKGNIPEDMESLLYDPQTSGGLLVALPEAEAWRLQDIGYLMGRVLPKGDKPLVVL